MDPKLRDAIQTLYNDPNCKTILRKWIKRYEDFAARNGFSDIYTLMMDVKDDFYFGNCAIKSKEHLQTIIKSTGTIRQLMFFIYLLTQHFRDRVIDLIQQGNDSFMTDKTLDKGLVMEKIVRTLKRFGLHAPIHDKHELVNVVFKSLADNIKKHKHSSSRVVLHAMTEPTAFELKLEYWREPNMRIKRNPNDAIVFSEVFPSKDDLIEPLTEEELSFLRRKVPTDLDKIDYLPYKTGSMLYRLSDDLNMLTDMFPQKLFRTSMSGGITLMLEIARIFKIDLRYIFMLMIPFSYIPKDHSLFEMIFVGRNYFKDDFESYNIFDKKNDDASKEIDIYHSFVMKHSKTVKNTTSSSSPSSSQPSYGGLSNAAPESLMTTSKKSKQRPMTPAEMVNLLITGDKNNKDKDLLQREYERALRFKCLD